uniref:C-type lectin domain-containing protein n=1 Tax=Strongyloides papillosus TaxID=174720 RepID=A0A0N5BVA1_STREA
MNFYLLIFLLFFQEISSAPCPQTPGFLLAPNDKCFKIFHGRHGYKKVHESCSQQGGILSGFVTDIETHGFNIIMGKHFRKIKEKYVDRGFTCHNKYDPCTMNSNHNETVTNKIEFLTDNFPCRGVMDIKKRTFHCVDMNYEENIIYACQKNSPHIKKCSNLDYEKYTDGNCYRIIGDFAVSKITAKAICKGASGTLPIVSNYFESHVIDELMKKIQHPTWLDFSCETSDASSCKWSTGEKMQVNHIGHFNLKDKNLCGYIGEVNSWSADHCDTQKRVICQIKD